MMYMNMRKYTRMLPGWLRRLLTAAIAAVVLIILSQGVAVMMDAPIVPRPLKVFERLGLIFSGDIAAHAGLSLWRIAAGLVAAVGIGYPLGLVMGYVKTVDKFLAPIVYLLYPVPKIALLPILMLLCGVGEISKVLMIFLIIVFQVTVAVRDSIRAIPEETYYVFRSLGASFGSIFSDVLWPAVLPKFITAVRVAMATAISVLFFTETYGTEYGMGYFIMDAWLRVNYLDMYAGIVVLSVIGLLLFASIDFIEKHVCAWQYAGKR